MILIPQMQLLRCCKLSTSSFSVGVLSLLLLEVRRATSFSLLLCSGPTLQAQVTLFSVYVPQASCQYTDATDHKDSEYDGNIWWWELSNFQIIGK